MDVAEYLPMFLAETQEHLQALNLAVVRVEERPDDRATVDEIFRVAHTMKGMSATMGFGAMAALTHAMEDVFELLRQRERGIGREAVDVLLECLDALEATVGAIAAHGEERLEPDELIARLRGLVRRRTPEQQLERIRRTVGDLAAAAGESELVHVRVSLEEDASMPSVRAFMVLGALADCGRLVGSCPDAESVEGFEGQHIDAWLAGARGADVIVAALGAVAEVAHVGVDAPEPVLPAAPEPVPAPAPEPLPAPEPAPDAAPGAAPSPAPAAPVTGPRRVAGTVRVDAERLDQLMHHMGELVVQRTLVESLVGQARVPGLGEAMSDLTRISQALQAMVMRVRMVPVEAVFLRFPRLVRDLSGQLGKQVELRLVGQDTELDRTVVDAVGDPLVHLVRNALDHGLETPAEREAAGKPPTGTLEISARHAGGSVVIAVRDDGRGVDPARVAAKAVERGLLAPDAAAGIDVARAAELLFTPGFSTSDTMTDISGRGVGMDAVRAAVREMGGDATLESQPGRGTTATIRLPLTLAIVNALLVETAGTPFAVPLDRVETTLALADHVVRSAAGTRRLVLRDAVLPLVDAGAALQDAPADGQFAVVVRAGGARLALTVDTLVGQRELVTRPLPAGVVSPRAAVSSGAVLSDGRIALIIDCDALAAGALGGAVGLAAQPMETR